MSKEAAAHLVNRIDTLKDEQSLDAQTTSTLQCLGNRARLALNHSIKMTPKSHHAQQLNTFSRILSPDVRNPDKDYTHPSHRLARALRDDLEAIKEWKSPALEVIIRESVMDAVINLLQTDHGASLHLTDYLQKNRDVLIKLLKDDVLRSLFVDGYTDLKPFSVGEKKYYLANKRDWNKSDNEVKSVIINADKITSDRPNMEIISADRIWMFCEKREPGTSFKVVSWDKEHKTLSLRNPEALGETGEQVENLQIDDIEHVQWHAPSMPENSPESLRKGGFLEVHGRNRNHGESEWDTVDKTVFMPWTSQPSEILDGKFIDKPSLGKNALYETGKNTLWIGLTTGMSNRLIGIQAQSGGINIKDETSFIGRPMVKRRWRGDWKLYYPGDWTSTATGDLIKLDGLRQV